MNPRTILPALLLALAAPLHDAPGAAPPHAAAARAEWERADTDLNVAYRELRGRLSPEAQKRLRSEQLEWIRYRDFQAEGIARNLGTGDGGAPAEIARWETMESLTRARANILRLYDGRGVAPGLDGRYDDGYGGELTIGTPDKRGFPFSFSVVRGPTAHTGEISGEARLDGDRATFSSPETSNGKPCILRFQIEGARISVRGENTTDYHGARAYFDGVYFKIANPAERPELPAHRSR